MKSGKARIAGKNRRRGRQKAAYNAFTLHKQSNATHAPKRARKRGPKDRESCGRNVSERERAAAY